MVSDMYLTEMRPRPHLQLSAGVTNPCTLMSTDFQFYKKMKLKFYFRFSFFFAVKKRNWTSIFVFHFPPSGRKRNSNSFNALRFSFSVAKKNGF